MRETLLLARFFVYTSILTAIRVVRDVELLCFVLLLAFHVRVRGLRACGACCNITCPKR